MVLVATLAATFPANVHMALHPERYTAVNRRLTEGRAVLRGGRRNSHRTKTAAASGTTAGRGETPAPIAYTGR